MKDKKARAAEKRRKFTVGFTKRRPKKRRERKATFRSGERRTRTSASQVLSSVFLQTCDNHGASFCFVRKERGRTREG